MVENSGENVSGFDSDGVNLELDINIIHRRLVHSENDAMQKLLKGDIVRGIDKVEVEALGSDFYKLGKLTK